MGRISTGLVSGLTLSNTQMSRIMMPVSVVWKPQPDITVYELARLLPLLTRREYTMPDELPTEPELLRHLKVYDPNKEQPQ